jgi:hypothetical protein
VFSCKPNEITFRIDLNLKLFSPSKKEYSSDSLHVEESFLKADNHSEDQEILLLYGNRRFITEHTNTCHWFPSSANSIESAHSHPISLSSIIQTDYRE